MMVSTIYYIIGQYCRNYRLIRLRLTLKEVEKNENVKALSSFEHGRSSNITHLLKYVEQCENNQQKVEFLEGLVATIEGG